MLSGLIERLKLKVRRRSAPTYYVLTDVGTNAVLAINPYSFVITFLQEALNDTHYIPRANHPNYPRPFFLSQIPAEQLPEWAWNPKDRTFAKTHPDIVTEALREKSRLAIARGDTYGKIIFNLSSVRSRLNKGVAYQERVYLTKKQQAEQFKSAGYDEDRLLEFPYVMQYADIVGMEPRQAADDILFKAKIEDDILFKTEQLRLEYCNKVKNAKDTDELQKIFRDFLKACYINARV